jgi:hypothetical protein
MSGEVKKRSFWVIFAWIAGLILVSSLVAEPLYRAAPANVKYAILAAAAVAIAVAMVWLFRATLRD